MEKWQVIGLLAAGFALLVGSVFIRAQYGAKYELKTIDLVLIVIPLIFVLLATGKMKVLEAFGVKADFSELFSDAAGTPIDLEVANITSPPVDEVVGMLEMAAKGSVQEIPRLVANKTQGLTFRLGHGGYYGPAIEKYFDALYASSYLQYLIINDTKGELFGVYDALDLAVYFRTESDTAYENFARWLNRADQDSLRQLSELPGFIAANQAVKQDQNKRQVLKEMDQLKADRLPVVDEQKHIIGTVNRAQLTASMILEVVDKLENNGGKSG